MHATYTPAFDLSPDLASTPTGLTDLGGGTREFSLSALVAQQGHYFLGAAEAQEIADEMVGHVIDHRADAVEVSMMRRHEREMMLTRTATPALIGGVRPGASKRSLGQRFPELFADGAAAEATENGLEHD